MDRINRKKRDCMEGLEKRYSSAQNAIVRLGESMERLRRDEKSSDREAFRDSVVKRFEFTYEAFWKFLRAYMGQKLMLETSLLSNARLVFQKARTEKLLSETEFAMCIRMIEDRNQTSHTYDENFADELVERVSGYIRIMAALLARVEL